MTTSRSDFNEEGDEDDFLLKKAIFSHNQAQKKQELYNLLDKLENYERDVVTCHYLFGYSYAEIAEMQKTTEGAVKVSAHRAIKKLRKLV